MSTPPVATNNIWYHRGRGDTVLILVHGIFSDCRSCWLREGAVSQFWPALIRRDRRFGDAAIFLGGYFTQLGAGSYDLTDCARELLRALKRPDIDSTPSLMDSYRRLFFICHSTGGIVVRNMLERWEEEFEAHPVGLALIASPSNGSDWATLAEKLASFYNQKLGLQLRTGDASLEDLDGRFRELLERRTIPTLWGAEAFENRFIFHRWWLPSWWRVVGRKSAVAGYWANATQLRGADHFTAVKPDGYEDPAHQFLVDTWLRFIDKTGGPETLGKCTAPAEAAEGPTPTPGARPTAPAIAHQEEAIPTAPGGHTHDHEPQKHRPVNPLGVLERRGEERMGSGVSSRPLVSHLSVAWTKHLISILGMLLGFVLLVRQLWHAASAGDSFLVFLYLVLLVLLASLCVTLLRLYSPRRRHPLRPTTVFRGTMAYRETDDLPGRLREVDELCRKVQSNRVVVLCGESGTGKSSLIRAGLIPRLRQQHRHMVPVYIDDWSSGPTLALQAAIKSALATSHPSLAHEVGLASTLPELLAILPNVEATLLLICDQFEQCLSASLQSDRTGALAFLNTCLSSQNVRLLVCLRKEWLLDLDGFHQVPPLSEVIRLGRIPAPEAEGIFGRMVHKTRLDKLGPNSVGEIIRDIQTDGGVLLVELQLIGQMIEREDEILSYSVYRRKGKDRLWSEYILDHVNATADPELAILILLALSMQEAARIPLNAFEIAWITQRNPADESHIRHLLEQLAGRRPNSYGGPDGHYYGVVRRIGHRYELTHDILAVKINALARERVDPVDIENARFFWDHSRRHKAGTSGVRLAYPTPLSQSGRLRGSDVFLGLAFLILLAGLFGGSSLLSRQPAVSYAFVPAFATMSVSAVYMHLLCRRLLLPLKAIESGIGYASSLSTLVVYPLALLVLLGYPRLWPFVGSAGALLVSGKLFLIAQRGRGTLVPLSDIASSVLVGAAVLLLSGCALWLLFAEGAGFVSARKEAIELIFAFGMVLFMIGALRHVASEKVRRFLGLINREILRSNG